MSTFVHFDWTLSRQNNKENAERTKPGHNLNKYKYKYKYKYINIMYKHNIFELCPRNITREKGIGISGEAYA